MTIAPTAVAEGLFEIVDGVAYLVGSRCSGCGTCYFPQALSCRHPACHNKSVQPVRLPRTGTLISFTVQRYRPPSLFRMDDWQPYAIGLIALGDGLEVMGMLDGVQLDSIRIGTEVTLLVAPLFREADGREVLTYKFAPREPA